MQPGNAANGFYSSPRFTLATPDRRPEFHQVRFLRIEFGEVLKRDIFPQYSDFPPPTEFPNFMHNSKMIQYLDMYADKYGMRNYIKVRHEVLSVKPTADYEETHRWEVKVKNLDDGEISEDVYDGVMVCTGA